MIIMIQEFCINFFQVNHFGQLLNFSPKYFIFLKTFNSEFSYIEVCFINQHSKPLEVEVTLVINA